MKSSQLKFVKKLLEENGKVTRNQSLKHGIYRLSAIIYILKHDFEMKIESKRVYKTKNRWDFEYFLPPKNPN